jgi:hypothetical protein
MEEHMSCLVLFVNINEIPLLCRVYLLWMCSVLLVAK